MQRRLIEAKEIGAKVGKPLKRLKRLTLRNLGLKPRRK
jgi:hypothetical protein